MTKRKRALILAILSFSAALLTLYSASASKAAYEAMLLCAHSVIPALFPYMVVSSLMVSTGAAEVLGKVLPLSHIYGLPKAGSAAIILGFVCGFPVGAACACDLYRRGSIGKSSAEALIAVSNNTGPSFVVSVIGGAFWHDITFGWWLFAFQVLSSFAAGITVNRVLMPTENETGAATESVRAERLSVQFSRAVSSGVKASLNVCGFVVFFAVVASFADLFFGGISLYFSALLEFTEGAKNAAALGGIGGAFLCGFTLGWSGISVFCQAGVFALSLGLSLKRCIITKLLQGVLCGAFCAVYTYCNAPKAVSIGVILPSAHSVFPFGCAILLLFSLYFLMKRYKM